MGAFNSKGNKFNKQANLASKMADAKRQRELVEKGIDPSAAAEAATKTPAALTDKEIKERNDRQRFDDLLNSSVMGGGLDSLGGGDGLSSDDEYLTEEQEDEEADAAFRGIDRIYEGDPAPTAPFPNLIKYFDSKPVGDAGTKRIVPWIKTPGSRDFVVVVSDPRPKSTELRAAMKMLAAKLPKDLLEKIAIVSADGPGENRRFVKKSIPSGTCRGAGANVDTGMGGSATGMMLLCDEKKEWMREYTALGEKGWSMTVFVLSEGRVQKVARDVEDIYVVDVVKNAVKTLR